MKLCNFIKLCLVATYLFFHAQFIYLPRCIIMLYFSKTKMKENGDTNDMEMNVITNETCSDIFNEKIKGRYLFFILL